MSLLAGLFLAATLQATLHPTYEEPLSDKLSLSLSSQQTTYYAGETLRLHLTLRNFSDTPVLGYFVLAPSAGKTVVSYRAGTSPFVELLHLDDGYNSVQPLTMVDPEGSLEEEFKIAFEPTTGLPFLNQTGEYAFQARYRDFDFPNAVLFSDTLHITVVDPPADQQEALAAYRSGVAFFAEFHSAKHNATPAQIQTAASFLEAYPDSLYWKDVRAGLWLALRERVIAEVARDSERVLFEELTANWTDDASPPGVAVVANPSTLWPPNHKLVPVSVTVTVVDDTDPNPAVVLESITCDDGCDPVLDVGDAFFGVDDREFSLRAERSGSGTGRTYTITYSATDASGNKAEATATVTVPHDQGKKKGKKK